MNSAGTFNALEKDMVRLTATLLLCVCCLAQTSAYADMSVWEKANIEAHSVTGKVVSIATDDDKILVRISDGKSTETFKVCSIYPGGDFTLAESERVKSLREAFNHGDTVRASYNGAFDRCLSTVEVTHEKEDTPKDKETPKNKPRTISQK